MGEFCSTLEGWLFVGIRIRDVRSKTWRLDIAVSIMFIWEERNQNLGGRMIEGESGGRERVFNESLEDASDERWTL